MNLRSFLFLDTNTLSDYLSAIEGFVTEGDIDQVETEKKDLSGKAGYKIIESEAATQKSKERKQTLAVTDAAKFQRLFEILEKDDGIKFLDLIDQDTWEQIRRGDIVEIEANVQLPKAFALTQAMDDFSPLLNIMSQFGQDSLVDSKTKAAFEGIQSVAKLSEGKPIPILFETSSTPGFAFASNLQRKFLRCQITDIEGSSTIFGKVQRVIRKGEKMELFSMLPALSAKLPSLNIKQQRQMQQNLAKQELAEVVKGPALIISTLAIYR